jgi:hypothetical protein
MNTRAADETSRSEILRSRLPSDPAFAVPAFVSPACAANLWEGYTSKGTLLAFKAARHHYFGPIP